MMDKNKKRKQRALRVAITNIFMGISVVAIVFVLMFIAMGYSFNNKSGELEQSGLVQIDSEPSGATVEIDGTTQFSHTEMNKMLSPGVHHLVVSKSGYDIWKKDLSVDTGLLTRIEWIRLFPVSPEVSDVASFKNVRLANYSADRKVLLVIEQANPDIIVLNIQDDQVNRTVISLATALGTDDATALTGTIAIKTWSRSSDKVLLTWEHNNTTTWHLVELNKDNAKKSLDLTTKFNLQFSNILIANDSASKLWGIENGNLRLIDADNLTISGVIAKNVEKITNNKDTVAFVNANDDGNRFVSTYKDGEDGPVVIAKLEKETPTINLAMGTYWGAEWLAYAKDKHVEIISGSYPSYGKSDSANFKTTIKKDLSYVPQLISVDSDERILALAADKNMSSIDLEIKHTYDYTFENAVSKINWLDGFLTWQKTDDNKIFVRDFDGDNQREIVSNADNDYGVNITDNNNWLYYFNVSKPETTEATTATTSTTTATTTTTYTLKREKLNI